MKGEPVLGLTVEMEDEVFLRPKKRRKRGSKGVPSETAQTMDFSHKSFVWES